MLSLSNARAFAGFDLAFWIVVGVLLVAPGGAMRAAEPPDRTSSFYGLVTSDGGSLSAAMEISAWIDGGVELSSAPIFQTPFGFWVYSIDLPVNDPATGIDEGGIDGQSVSFKIEGAAVGDPVLFQGSTYQLHSLQVPTSADLALVFSNGGDELQAGATSTWTLDVSNLGEGDAEGLALIVELPDEASFVSADQGGILIDGRVEWPVFDLGDGAGSSRSLTLQVASAVAADSFSLPLVARVVDDGSRGLDPNPANNFAKDADRLGAHPDLGVTLDDGLASIEPGEFADFQLTIDNHGSRHARKVALSVTLAAGVLFQTADADGGELQPETVSWPDFELQVGETVNRTFRVLVPSDLDVGTAVLENRAFVAVGNGPDANPTDNSALDHTTVDQKAGLRPVTLDTNSMIVDPQTLEISGAVTVEIENNGNLDLHEPFAVTIFEDLDGDGLFDSDLDRTFGAQTVNEVWAAGSTIQATVSVTGFVSFRDNVLWAFVDSGQQIPELDETDNYISTSFSCVSPPPVRQFDPVVEMSWPRDDTNLEEPNAKESMSTPIVVQLTDDNGDGKMDENDSPDIVFVATDLIDVLNPKLRLRAIDGATGRSHWAVLPPVSDLLIFSLSGLAAGDLDGDGDTEIIVSTPSPPLPGLSGHSNHLTAYNHNGQKLWSSPWYQTHPTGSTFTNRDQPTIADLDGNGKAEVIVGGNVFSHTGALKWRGSAGQGYQSARNQNKSDSGAISIVADLDMDGSPEIVAGNTVYRADGSIYWQSPLGDGYTAVANFDADDFPEVVVVSRGTVRLHEHDGGLVWGPVDLPGVEPNAGGAPTVADFDGDGEPEIGVAGSDFYTVFEADGSTKWQRAVRDESSNQTGSTVFDFDADGRFEVVYRDEAYLYIFAGDTGEVLFQDPLSSFTANEEPVVVDIDRDGQAEILVSSDLAIELSGLPKRTTGLRVYGDRNGTWVAARSVWNQHAYSIDHVDDDGGIAQNAAYGWLTHNTFRANVSPIEGPTPAPDLTISYLRVDRGTFPQVTVTARVGNGGAYRTLAGVPIALYDGSPESGGSLLGVTTTSRLLTVGAYEDVSFDVSLPTIGTVELVAVLGDADSGAPVELWDCRQSNNRHAWIYDIEDLGLWLTLGDGREAVQVAETVTYSVIVGNSSPASRSGISLQAFLPEHATSPVAGDGGTISGNQVLWPTFGLAPGTSVVRTLSFVVDPALPLDVTEMVTRAWVQDDGTIPDATPWDQSASDTNAVTSVRADAGGPYAGDEGTSILFDASASSDRNGTVVAWRWDFDGDGAFDDGDGVTAEWTFDDDGVYTVRVQAVDDSGETGDIGATVTVGNLPPVVDFAATLLGTEGDVLTLTGASFVDPGTLDTHTVTVDWGDGTVSDGVVDPATGELRASHLYTNDGNFTVTLCVQDDDGAQGCATSTASLANSVPEILDDGAVDLSTWLPQHLSNNPNSQGDWDVSADGTSVVQTENVAPTVLLSPFAVAGVSLEGDVRPGSSSDDDFLGFVIGFEPGDFQNPDADYLLIDWKRGTQYNESLGFAQKGLALSRIRGVPITSELWSHEERPMHPTGSFDALARGLTTGQSAWGYDTTYSFRIQVEGQRIRVWVDDVLQIDESGDFRFGAGRFGFYNYSQENVRYQAFTAVGEGIFEGEEAALSLQFLDPGIDDPHTATVDWEDGTSEALTVQSTEYGGVISGSHLYPDDGVFLAQACVQDEADEGCGQVPFTVLNVAPSFDAGPDRAAFSDTGLQIDIPFTDPGLLDTHIADIEWGDGTTELVNLDSAGGVGRLQATKSYDTEGVYPVEICLKDNGGAEQCDTFEVFWTQRFVDLAVQAWSTVPAIRAGATATLGVDASNEGSLPVTGVQVVWELPPEVSFVSATDAGIYDAGLHRAVWTVGGLDYKESIGLTVEVAGPAASPAIGSSIPLTGRASVSDDGNAGVDVDASNNVSELGLLLLDGSTPFPVLDVEGSGFGIDEGTTLNVLALIDDPDSSGHTATVDWGDGGSSTATVTVQSGLGRASASHRYVEDGLYTLQLCVSDGTYEGCQSRLVEVRNLAPNLLESDENVDLRLWQAVDLDIGSQNPADWVPSNDGSHVYQKVNARASVYYSDFPAFGTRLETEMWLGPQPILRFRDDDYIGLVLGWTPGDTVDPDGDFLLISWKQEDDEGAKKGLWVSRITGDPSTLWKLETASRGVEVLAKGRTLHETGWQWTSLYGWTVEYGPDHLRVWVDDSLEIDLYNPQADYPAGSFGFYNYSQDYVMYRGVSRSRFAGVEGFPTAIEPLFFDGGELDTHIASVRWGDGVGPETVSVRKTGTVSTILGDHVYAENGVYVGRACAIDDEGARGCGLFEVDIQNAPPVVDPGDPGQALFAAPFELFDVSLRDPGVFDTHTVSILWGDGSSDSGTVIATATPGSFTVQASHSYVGALGDYTVTICAVDDEGAQGCADKVVSVSGASAPQDLLAAVTPSEEGAGATLTGTFADPDTGDIHTSTVDWGDGSGVTAIAITPAGSGGSGGSAVAEHPYIDDGIYAVRWCVTDGQGLSDCVDVSAVVSNLSPHFGEHGGEQAGEVGESAGFHSWQSESLYAAQPGQWTVSDHGRRVRQSSNDDSIFFYGQTPVLNTRSHVTARMWEEDNDYIGMALGYEPGDLTNPDADYLMILWKQENQSGSGPLGLKIARVRGTSRSFWAQSGADFESLGQGAIHGNRGWRLSADYRFTYELTPERLRLWVNDRLEADIAAPADDPFQDGHFALFTHAQEYVVFRDFEQQALPADERATHFWAGADLSTWQAESFWDHDTAPNWAIQNDGEYVQNTANSHPGALLSPEDHLWRKLRFVARPYADDDYFGMVIGYQPGDAFDEQADYLLMVWKALAENGSLRGLKLYRITGRPGSFFDLTGTQGVSLVASAATLGSTAWGTDLSAFYEFEIDPRPDGLRVWVNGTLQFDVDTAVPSGRYGLYVYRHTAIRFIGTRLESADVLYEGDTSTSLGAGFSDSGKADTHTGSIQWNDGSATETASITQLGGLGTVLLPEHVFQDDVTAGGVTVCATDDEGAQGCGDVPLRVLNLAPSVDAGLALESVVGGEITLSGGFSDPGALDTHTYTVDWGDGSGPSSGAADAGVVNAPHVYTAEAIYSVTLCVVDDDGGQGCDSTDVTVTGVTTFPELTLSKTDTLFDDRDGDGMPSPGDSIRYTLTASNIGSGPATSIVLRDPIPAHTTLLSGSVAAGEGTAEPVVIRIDPIELEIGTLIAGETVQYRFDVEVVSPIPSGVSEIENQALLVSNELPTVISDDPSTAEADDPTITSLVDAGQSAFCVDDAFDSLDGWSTAEIGDAAGDASIVDGKLEVTSTGSSLYHDDDHGVFVYRSLDGDFRIEVDVESLPVDVGGLYRKACLMVRSSTAPDAARAMACYAPGFPDGAALMFDARPANGGTATELASSQVGIALGARLSFVRRGDALTVGFSEDAGVSWIEPLGGLGGSVTFAGAPSSLQVGLMVASYDAAQPMTTAFDDFRRCRKAETPAAPAGQTPVCTPDEPLDVVYVLDLSESMTAEFPGADPGAGTSKLSAAVLGLKRVQNRIALRGDGSRSALLTFHGQRDPAANLSGAVDVLVSLNGDSSAVSAALEDLADASVAPLATTPTALALEQVLAVLAADRDPGRRAAMVLVTDGVPNIDRDGRGHHEYRLSEMQDIGLVDDSGAFLPWTDVAWLGRFNGIYGTFDGEPMANAMFALDRLVLEQENLTVYGVGIQGDGEQLGTFNLDLVDYAAWVSGGMSFAPSTHDAMRSSMDLLLQDLECGAVATGGLGDRVWNDLDGDGVQDTGEPGISGVAVELLDAEGQSMATAQSDWAGGYRFVDVPLGEVTVRIDASTLPIGLSTATFDADADLLGQATVQVTASETRTDVDFGYTAAAIDPPQPTNSTVCVGDDFEGSLDPDWTLTAIGGADSGDAVVSGGRLELSSNGSALWEHDRFHFLHRTVPNGDFRVEVEIPDVPLDPESNDLRKGGLHVRSGLAQDSSRIMVNYLPYLPAVNAPALQFGYRSTDGGASSSLSYVVADVSLPVRLAIERRGSTYTVWYSTDDGMSWQQETRGFVGGVVELDLGSAPVVGVGVASYDPLASMTLAFDDFASCEPDPTPLPTTPDPGLCDPAQPLDVALILDLSGSMGSVFDGATDRLDAAKSVIERWAELLSARADGSRASLVVYDGGDGGDDAATHPIDAARILAGLGDPEALSTVLEGFSAAGLAPDAGSASPPALHRAGSVLLAAADPTRRPAIVWLTDEPPTFDGDGFGPYGLEGSPLQFELADGQGGWLSIGRVGWLGPFFGDWGTFAGEPLADSMAEVLRWKTWIPDLRIVGLALDGNGVDTPRVDHDLLSFAASYTSSTAASAPDLATLLSATDSAYSTLVCR